MRTEIDTTVVTVTWNSQSVIGSFLECLNAAMGEVAWQLIVADNDSHDSTLEITREVMSNARVVQLGRNAGYAAGINAAIEVAQRGTNVLVANPDVRLDAGAGQHLVESLRETRVGIAVPQLRDSTGELVFNIRRDATVMRALGEALLGGDRAGRWSFLGETVTRVAPYARAADVDWASGAVMAISRDCAERCRSLGRVHVALFRGDRFLPPLPAKLGSECVTSQKREPSISGGIRVRTPCSGRPLQ